MEPQKRTSDPDSISNWETLKEQSSTMVRNPRTWCRTMVNLDSNPTYGLVFGQDGPVSALETKKRKLLKRKNPNPKIIRGLQFMRGNQNWRSNLDRVGSNWEYMDSNLGSDLREEWWTELEWVYKWFLKSFRVLFFQFGRNYGEKMGMCQRRGIFVLKKIWSVGVGDLHF
jgi:hypothetical protein